VSFQAAVQTVFSKYVDFSGRARRSEYWYFVLFNFAASLVARILDAVLGGGPIQALLTLALFLPGLAVMIRRFHDTGRSGWSWLWSFTIIGIFFVIRWLATDSDRGDNQYGPSPKGLGLLYS
jgi:uncharacterized membrane protein YhaH (DUF805 family)